LKHRMIMLQHIFSLCSNVEQCIKHFWWTDNFC
jgi:hypothetical protein